MRIGYLFPGQGSQHPGMGRDVAAAFPPSRDVYRLADRVLGRPLSQLCFDGSLEELALTENTQPAILATSIAVLRALESRGIRPAAAAGHSLGEYSAHVAAGTFGLEDALRAVSRRAALMQAAVPPGDGAMAAVLGLAPEVVHRLCASVAGDQVVSAANLNAPNQTVVAGHRDAVDRLADAARQAGARRVVPLAVSAPFHCHLMEPAATQLRPVLESLEFRDPAFPVYCNADARPVTRGPEAREALLRQVASPVRWTETVQRMLDDGIEAFVEVGPGRVLSGLVRAVRKDVPVRTAHDPDGVERVASELGA